MNLNTANQYVSVNNTLTYKPIYKVSACSEISSALVTQQITVETQESTQKGRTYFYTTP